MFIPGGFLSGTVLSWLLVAPAIPLCVLLIRRPHFNNLSISLVLLCVVSLLTSSFNLVIPAELPVNRSFQHFSVFLEFLFNLLVLKGCIHDKKHQSLIVNVGLVFCGIFLSVMLINGSVQYPATLIRIGYALLFVLALTVIGHQFKDISRHLSAFPAFWISAGIFFQYGLVSLLLLLNEGLSAERLSEDRELGVIYTIIYMIRFIFFAIGLLLFKKGMPED